MTWIVGAVLTACVLWTAYTWLSSPVFLSYGLRKVT
jgi:hypothetical protein